MSPCLGVAGGGGGVVMVVVVRVDGEAYRAWVGVEKRGITRGRGDRRRLAGAVVVDELLGRLLLRCLGCSSWMGFLVSVVANLVPELACDVVRQSTRLPDSFGIVGIMVSRNWDSNPPPHSFFAIVFVVPPLLRRRRLRRMSGGGDAVENVERFDLRSTPRGRLQRTNDVRRDDLFLGGRWPRGEDATSGSSTVSSASTTSRHRSPCVGLKSRRSSTI